MSDTIRSAAHAKINLWLRVFGRDTKGYHAIESLFQLISLADTVDVTKGGKGITLEGAPESLGPAKDNLVVRAAERFFKATGLPAAATIRLDKKIPWSAGLGGGSSDAAVTLHALNSLHANRLSPGDLMAIGAEIGSDVPFFLTRASLALGWGRGERLLALPALPKLPLLIVPPPVPVKTADAYAWIDKDRGAEETGEFAAVTDASALNSWDAVRRLSHNDFESAVSARLPEIGHWLDRVRETVPYLARLCGSGGAVFALYQTASQRDSAAKVLGSDKVILGETLSGF